MTASTPTPVSRSELAGRLELALDEDLAADFRESVAENTWRAYIADLNDFDAWCRSKRRSWTTPDTVAAYFRALEEAGAAYATIGRRKTAIAKLVEAEALLTGELHEDPTKHPKAAVTLKAIRRRLGTDQDQAIPLTADRLIQVLLSIDDQTLAGRRDIALLLIGFYGAMRRSELSGMLRDHLEIDDNGVGINLPHTKTAQDHSVWVPILRQPTSRWDPVAALAEWLDALDVRGVSQLTHGIWLRITKGDTFTRPPRPISGDAVNNLVIRRVRGAGLMPPPSDDPTNVTTTGELDLDLDKEPTYSAHSLRAGFITEAKNRGIDEADIMKHSRHKSLQQMRTYDRTSGWWNRNATAGLAL